MSILANVTCGQCSHAECHPLDVFDSGAYLIYQDEVIEKFRDHCKYVGHPEPWAPIRVDL